MVELILYNQVVNSKKYKMAFVVGIMLAGYVGISLFQAMSKNFKIKAQIDDLETKIERLEEENQQLSNKISYYQTDNYKERSARENLGLQTPDEKLVITTPQPEPQAEPTGKKDGKKLKPQAQVSNLTKWYRFFFNPS